MTIYKAPEHGESHYKGAKHAGTRCQRTCAQSDSILLSSENSSKRTFSLAFNVYWHLSRLVMHSCPLVQ